RRTQLGEPLLPGIERVRGQPQDLGVGPRRQTRSLPRVQDQEPLPRRDLPRRRTQLHLDRTQLARRAPLAPRRQCRGHVVFVVGVLVGLVVGLAHVRRAHGLLAECATRLFIARVPVTRACLLILGFFGSNLGRLRPPAIRSVRLGRFCGGEEVTDLLTNSFALTPPHTTRCDSHRCAFSLLDPLTEESRQHTAPLSNATAPTPRSFTRSCDDDVLGHHALLLADSAAVKEARLTPPFYPISENRISGRTIGVPTLGEGT